MTITFTNQDAGVLHNVAAYQTRAAARPIFVGEIFAGVATREYMVATPPPADYFFRCDVHPDMDGTVVVE